MTININPHVGINDIYFGLSQKEVHASLGLPDSTKESGLIAGDILDSKTDYFRNNNLQIFYDENNTVEFIQLSLQNSSLQISIFDFNLNEASAEETIHFLTTEMKLRYNEQGDELPYTFDFITEDLSFWREAIPEHEEDEEGKYFDAVSIGKVGYLNN